jgi:hypothetical protein
MSLLLVAFAAFQGSVTKEEMIRLSKEGASEASLLDRASQFRGTLSADEVVELKAAGLSDPVVVRLLEGPRDLKVLNLAPKPVTLRIVGSTLRLGEEGEIILPGSSLSLPARGEYTLVIRGRETAGRVTTPATLTFRGSIHPEFEVVTLYVDDARGSDTWRVESRIRD